MGVYWQPASSGMMQAPRGGRPRRGRRPPPGGHGLLDGNDRRPRRPWTRRCFCSGLYLPLALALLAAVLLLQYSVTRLLPREPWEAPGWSGWRGGPAAAPQGLEMDIDVVSVSVKPTCVTRKAVEALNRYLHPRTIHIVTVEQAGCAMFEAHAANVRCRLEDQVLPGVTKAKVAGLLEDRFSRDGAEEFNGRSLAGWYLQQFLKLGAAEAIPSLTDTFVIWDLDMIALRPIRILQEPDTPAGGEPQTLVNIGGANNPGYDDSWTRLFGSRLTRAPDGSSLVTHWIVAQKSLMAEFLRDLSSSDSEPLHRSAPTEELAWVWRILGSVSAEHLTQGFSEYASYVSWVHQKYPSTQAIAARRDWLRHPLGGKMAIKAFRLLRADGLCCPSALHMWLTRLFGYRYTGFEIGHTPVCHYTEERYSDGYGLR